MDVNKIIFFFIEDSIKILALLFGMIFVLGVLRTFLPADKIKHWMTKRGVVGNIFAAMFGAVTPFCSCSSIPLFLSFVKAGIPLGVTFSFLVTSPIINEYLVVLMIGLFGWKITLCYVLGGLVIGVSSGVILGRLKLEKYLATDLFVNAGHEHGAMDFNTLSLKSRICYGLNEAISMLKKIWIWVLTGVAVGALIKDLIPQDVIQSAIASTGIFSVPMAVLLGAPIYGSCAAIVPIAMVLFQKGIPLGTALAFMMAVSALSLPEAVILRRVMRTKLIIIFFTIVIIGIIVMGYLVNFFQPLL